jgi:integrase
MVTLINEKQLIERSISFYFWLQSNRNRFCNSVQMDPISWLIITKTNPQFKLDAFLQSYSLLRYSDLHQIKIEELITGNSQMILQNKTKKIVELRPLLCLESGPAKVACRYVHPFYFGRDAYENALKKAIPSWVVNSLEGNHSVTHVFRYLRASFLLLSTDSIKFASKLLGHSTDEATLNYIPTKLVGEFKNYLHRS